jgi:hypothetical protein
MLHSAHLIPFLGRKQPLYNISSLHTGKSNIDLIDALKESRRLFLDREFIDLIYFLLFDVWRFYSELLTIFEFKDVKLVMQGVHFVRDCLFG